MGMIDKESELFLNYITEEYNAQLKELKQVKHQCKLNIDYTLLNDFSIEQTGKEFFDLNFYRILNNSENKINEERTDKNHISLKLVDVPPYTLISELDATNNGEFISAKGMIKNITTIQPTLKTAVYECRGCMRLYSVEVADKKQVTMPSLCNECGGRSFRLLPEQSVYRNYRYVKLEEPLELRSGGNTREIKGYMQDYLASPYHNIKAGDVVDVTGQFRLEKKDKNKKSDDFEFMINLHNINSVNNPFEDYRLTEDDKKEIIQLSQTENIYERLVGSLAPEIFGYDTVKEGLLLQLFEGSRPFNDSFKSDVMDRWTIHILLIGDPGIGKSQIIAALKKRTPKIISIAGTGTSQAGLTTSAVKDELTGTWTMEAGAVVLADTGLLCIDEYDKLSPSAQKSLNEPMEQLSVSSAKAGLVQTMTARTSVLACANPKYSRFNKYKTLNEQIDIPESNLSRFDLVFALEDTIEEKKDRKLANSLLSKNELNDIDIIPVDLFKKYITFAKLEIFPVLSDEAKEVLIDFYVATRQAALEDSSAKPITARDLKALERLTIARAKTELREVASVDDARNAIRIYGEALHSIGLTPETKGSIELVKSDAEMQLINDTENMIRARMDMYGCSLYKVNLKDIRFSVGLRCHELQVDVDEILKLAIENLEKSL
jgi:replicative DNA helicase Mcm